MRAHNELAAALRTQRAHLVQRELLLDTVMQNSPVALVLVDAHERIAYANLAARHLLSEGRSLNGLRFGDMLERAPAALRNAAADPGRQPVLGRDRRAPRKPSTCRSAPSFCREARFGCTCSSG